MSDKEEGKIIYDPTRPFERLAFTENEIENFGRE
jgi:hypothetical protein